MTGALRDLSPAATQRLIENSILHLDTGYYGRPGRTGGKVHVHAGRGPICGTVLPEGSEFQWCAKGIKDQYLECKRCIAAVRGLRARYPNNEGRRK